MTKNKDKAYNINNEIKAPNVFLVERKQVLSTREALLESEKCGLDLVQVSTDKDGNAVCKIMDWQSFVYHSEKKRRQIRKEEKSKNEEKCMRFSIKIEDNDLYRKLTKVLSWVNDGKTVNIVIMRRRKYRSLPIEPLKEKITSYLLPYNCKYKETTNPLCICVYT